MTLLRKLSRLFGFSTKNNHLPPIVVEFRSDGTVAISGPSSQSDQREDEWRVEDFRSEEEKLLEANALAGKVDSDLEQTVDELLACVQHSQGDKHRNRSLRIVHLGEILHSQGGMSRMKLAAYRFGAKGGRINELSAAWHGIGEWQD